MEACHGGGEMAGLLADTFLESLTGERPLSLQELCRECHIARSTFYYYYQGLPGLVQALFRRDLVDGFRDMAGAYGLQAAILYDFSYLRQYRQGIRFLCRHADGGIRWDTFRMEMEETVLGLLREEARNRHTLFREDALRFYGTLLTGFLVDRYQEYLAGGTDDLPEKTAENLTGLLNAVFA